MFACHSPFSIEARSAITTFKRIWRQNKTNFIQNGLDISTFNIKRKQIKSYSAVDLFHAIEALRASIHSIIKAPGTKLYAHKGLTNFLETLKALTKNHRIQNGQVIHLEKYATELLISILQELPQVDSSKALGKNTLEKIQTIQNLNHGHAHEILSNSLAKLNLSDQSAPC